MKITSTIEFKSEPEFFDKEKSERKNNTVRIVNDEEDNLIQSQINNIKYISIINNTDEKMCPESFVRTLTDISRFEHYNYNKNIIYIFSWSK